MNCVATPIPCNGCGQCNNVLRLALEAANVSPSTIELLAGYPNGMRYALMAIREALKEAKA